MAEAKMRHNWDIGALLWVTLAEPHRNKNERVKPFTISDVHPYRQKQPDQQLTAAQAKQYFPMSRG